MGFSLGKKGKEGNGKWKEGERGESMASARCCWRQAKLSTFFSFTFFFLFLFLFDFVSCNLVQL